MPSSSAPETDERFVARIRDTYRSLEVTPRDLGAIHAEITARQRHRRLFGGGALLAAATVTVALIAQPWSGDPGTEGQPPESRAERPDRVMAEPRQPSGQSEEPGRSDHGVPPVMVMSGINVLEIWGSETKSDWADADVVVVAEVITESEGRAGAVGDGSGDVLIERSVELSIREVLWSRGGPGSAVGEAVRLEASGWMDQPGRTRVRVARSQMPRLEVANAYVLALVNKAECAVMPRDRTGWMILGSSAAWPVENSIIGTGESEGRRVAGDADQALLGSLEEQMMGRTVEGLRHELANLQATGDRYCPH